MFNFNNANQFIEKGNVLTDTTRISAIDTELFKKIFDATHGLEMSDSLTTIIKSLMSKTGIIEDSAGEQTVVNAVCFFRSPVKGVGALLNDPEFRIYELDVSSANIKLTDYAAGGVINRSRNITEYNKSRQFHKDDIVCIIPVNSRGVDEYCDADEYIMNIYHVDVVDIKLPAPEPVMEERPMIIDDDIM